MAINRVEFKTDDVVLITSLITKLVEADNDGRYENEIGETISILNRCLNHIANPLLILKPKDINNYPYGKLPKDMFCSVGTSMFVNPEFKGDK